MITNKSWERLTELVKKRDKYICQLCGRFDSRGEVDHNLPLSRGGSDAIHNLCWTCKTCNRSKGDKTIREWAQHLGTKERQDVLGMIHDFLESFGHIPGNLLTWAMEQPNPETIPFGIYMSIMYEIGKWIQQKAFLLSGIPEEIIIAADAFLHAMAQLESIEDGRRLISSPEEMVPSHEDAIQKDFTRLSEDTVEGVVKIGVMLAEEQTHGPLSDDFILAFFDSEVGDDGNGCNKIIQFPLWG